MLGAAFCLPCSETLDSAGASRKSSPGCYGRIKNAPKHRAAGLLPTDQMCGFLWDSSSSHCPSHSLCLLRNFGCSQV